MCACVCIFPGGSDGKESTCNVGDLGSIPGAGRSPGEGNVCTFQYSCLENSMDRGASWLQSMRLQRVKHNRVTNTFTFSYICIYMHIGEGNDNPLQYSSLENPMDSRESWWATVWGGHKESDMTDRLTLHFIYTHTCILFQILFPYRLLQDIE